MFEYDVSKSGIVDKDAGVAGLGPQGMETARLLIKKYASDLIDINSAKARLCLQHLWLDRFLTQHKASV